MARQTINDVSLVEKLFEVFRIYGYENTSIAQLSLATGLKKSSLYHRFPAGKDDMVKAVVMHSGEQLHKYLITPLLDRNKAPDVRFANMLSTVNEFYNGGRNNCLFNVLNIGDTKVEIRALLNEGYIHWIEALTQLGKEAGQSEKEAKEKSERFLVVVQGALVIQRLTNNTKTLDGNLQREKIEFFRE